MHRIYLSALFFLMASPQTGTGPATNVEKFQAGSEPACNQARRGTMIVSLGATGRPDGLEVCLRDGLGRYSWVAASTQNPNSFARTRKVGGCPIFPDNNVWNSTADKLPVSSESAAIMATFAGNRLGTVPAFSLNLADSKTPAYSLQWGTQETDNGKYPISPNMRMEGATRESTVAGAPYKSDSHLLVLQTDECKLYEIFALQSSKAPFKGGSGAIFDLTSNSLRPDGWTSGDAAGLPIWPGVLTYDELYGGGEIRHMIRFSLDKSRNSYVWPARHFASRSDSGAFPPMGSRWRLKAATDENVCHAADRNGQPYPPEMKRLIHGLKGYGIILADNGLAIRILTDADARWGNPGLPTSQEYILNGWTHCLTGKDFEVVDASGLMVNPNSGEIRQ